ncbi:MAG: phosphonate metabolism protein/1,5-bisphosphokinase (PRPP-forming) PhnN [Candidatus Lokiarchaeota archaeon]|nr:phosphonate metabolism protein/1,5-bisphosphokinase (PRPP-forming) PhnN [Candidatus Lokiarchaeota archaeon]
MKDFQGTLFLIIGNSGSGKDSIISGVIDKYPSNLKKIHAPKRYITRKPSEFEKNLTISSESFKEMEEQGKFALSWQIYGLNYGIPIEIEDYLEKGHPVIINVSRTIIKQARNRYKNIKVVFIEVPLEITLQRIKNRKRESEELLKERIERARKNQKFPEADLTIDNSGKLEDAINKFFTYLINFIKK